jgi:hypothetical protein
MVPVAVEFLILLTQHGDEQYQWKRKGEDLVEHKMEARLMEGEGSE